MMTSFPLFVVGIVSRRTKKFDKLPLLLICEGYSVDCGIRDDESQTKKPWELHKSRLSLSFRPSEDVDVPTPKPRRRRTKNFNEGNINQKATVNPEIGFSRYPTHNIFKRNFPFFSNFKFHQEIPQKLYPLFISNRKLHSESASALESSLQEEHSLLINKGEDILMKMLQNIYCQGTLLAAVQTAKLFVDCKHFVDMPLKSDAESTLKSWNELISKAENGQIESSALAAFVQEHFEQPGGELENHEPADFIHEVSSFSKITDPAYRTWAQELHRKWPSLCRKVSNKVFSEPKKYSLIPLPNPFVVPGGRFREMYYWDSFFTIKGLLASEMYSTVRQMIENMGWLIETFGYVPNGNRIYYLNRSQPPLLTWCVDAYYQATKDLGFVHRALIWLEKEMEFFTQNRKIQKPDWKTHLYRYHVIASGPRPESYREDVESAEHIVEAPEKLRLWGDIMAAAESGRDFSSRWFHNDGPMAGKMGSTRTSSILPVDLNSIICGNLRIFSYFYTILGMTEEANKAFSQYQLMKETIHQVFWNEDLGCWFDFDLDTNKHVSTYFDTNFFPLAAGCVHEGFNPEKIKDYLNSAGVLDFPGGVPTSLISSGQQWDFPNSWAPTTWIIIDGLRKNGMPELAKAIAEKWVRKNYTMWASTGGRMFEKYNVATQCLKALGGGGEYEVQEGFGWTNGVILDLLLTYSQELSWQQPQCQCCSPNTETMTTNTAPQDSFVHCGMPGPVLINCIVPQEA